MTNNRKRIRIVYNEQKDSYDLETFTAGAWELISRFQCVRQQGEQDNKEPMFINCSIVHDIHRAIIQGYTLVI